MKRAAASHLSIDDTVGDLLQHPAFASFARLLLPWDGRRYDRRIQLNAIGSLMPYHSQVDPPASDADVFLSRDGKTLLWSSARTGHYEIWGAGGDGSAPRRISDDGVDAENPSLSRDGSTIVYVSFDDAKRGIWKIGADGTDAKILAPGRNILPEISPDGAWVSFVNQIPVPTIEVVRLADGAPVFRIPNIPAGRGFIAGRHRWLPDGLGIAFLGVDGLGTALFVQDVVPGRDTAATRRKLAVFEPDVEFHSFGLAPDMTFVVVAARQPTSNLLEIDGLPDDVAPTRPGRH